MTLQRITVGRNRQVLMVVGLLVFAAVLVVIGALRWFQEAGVVVGLTVAGIVVSRCRHRWRVLGPVIGAAIGVALGVWVHCRIQHMLVLRNATDHPVRYLSVFANCGDQIIELPMANLGPTEEIRFLLRAWYFRGSLRVQGAFFEGDSFRGGMRGQERSYWARRVPVVSDYAGKAIITIHSTGNGVTIEYPQ